MGIEPTPNGYELGDPCPVCWGFKTPKRFLAIVTGVNKCPGRGFNLNGFWVMSQVSSCVWRNLEWPWKMTYNSIGMIFPVTSFFFVSDVFDTGHFSGSDPERCTTSFENGFTEEDCGANIESYGGSVNLYFGPGI